MSIPLLITRGFGTGSLQGNIAGVVTRGFITFSPTPEFPENAVLTIYFDYEDSYVMFNTEEYEVSFLSTIDNIGFEAIDQSVCFDTQEIVIMFNTEDGIIDL